MENSSRRPQRQNREGKGREKEGRKPPECGTDHMKNHGRTPGPRDIVYGINACRSVIENAPERILSAWVARGRDRDRRFAAMLEQLKACGIRVQEALGDFLDEKSDGGVHQGVVLEIRAAPPLDEHFLKTLLERAEGPQLYLVLDGITDQRNLGAALRCAWAAGADAVVVPRDRAARLCAPARKAAAGAAEKVPLAAVTNLARTLDLMREHGVEVVGLAAGAPASLFDYDFQPRTALVLGSEGSGMRRLTSEKCDAVVRIPMAEGVESLNVSAAAAVSLFELVRRRSLKQATTGTGLKPPAPAEPSG